MSKIDSKSGDICVFIDSDARYGCYRFDTTEVETGDVVKIIRKTKRGTFLVKVARTKKEVGGVFKRDLEKYSKEYCKELFDE